MVIQLQRPSSVRGFLMVELIVAMAILVVAIFPLAYSVNSEVLSFRSNYQRALALEIVDGEMEILAAGEWQAYPEGRQTYPIHARAAANLPEGKFELTRTGNHVRLEWSADRAHGIGIIFREATLK